MLDRLAAHLPTLYLSFSFHWVYKDLQKAGGLREKGD